MRYFIELLKRYQVVLIRMVVTLQIFFIVTELSFVSIAVYQGILADTLNELDLHWFGGLCTIPILPALFVMWCICLVLFVGSISFVFSKHIEPINEKLDESKEEL